MIEKFTKEELEIIRQELKELPKAHQKRDLCKPSFRKLYEVYKHRNEYKKFFFRDIEEQILILADHIMCNYEPNPQRAGYWRRSIFVPNKYGKEYTEFVNEIVDICLKHYKNATEEELFR